MEKAIDRFLTLLMAVSAAAFTAVTLAYIARYDLGFSREEIRTFAVVAASVAVALVVTEFFGKRLRKLK
jgi:ABC-type proline/glycine betaine transport system permease subunit